MNFIIIVLLINIIHLKCTNNINKNPLEFPPKGELQKLNIKKYLKFTNCSPT